MPGSKSKPRRLELDKSEPVIIIAPVGDDAAAIETLLNKEGFTTQICQDVGDASDLIKASAGALLLTEEALESGKLPELFEVLKAQPAWSELPLIILTSGGESRQARLLDLAAAAAGAITLLERPINTRTLVRSVQVALRSRRRQYEVRDLLAELKRLNQTLEQRVFQRTAEAVDRAEKLRQLSAELSLAEERERRRIAQILHDDLQQLLMAARMNFIALRKTTRLSKRRVIMHDMAVILEQSFELTRSLSTELAPAVLYESGLAAALEWLATQTRKHHDLKVTVQADPAADPKAEDVRVLLFRAVRELLLNTIKHAGGSPVQIVMGNDGPYKVRIVVSDQGIGFDPANIDVRRAGPGGLGLFSIRERISSAGGEFQIESAPGRGTRVTLLAPR